MFLFIVKVLPIFMMDFLRQRTFAPAISFSDYAAYYPNFFVGFGIAVSKDFSLTDKLFLETKAQASLAPEVYELFTIGLAIKYKVK